MSNNISGASVTSKGQITIPVSFRRILGLKAGETVRFKLAKNNQVVIEKNDWKQQLDKLHQKVATHLKNHHIKSLNDEELDAAINASAAESAKDRYERGR